MRRWVLLAASLFGGAFAAPVAGAPVRVLGGDIITLSAPTRDDPRHGRAQRYSSHDIIDERQLAQLGKVDSEFNLGVMYTVNERYRSACVWFRRAALRGHREASYNLAVLMLNGQGVEPDDAKAAEWLLRSAKRGLPEAEFLLGRLHFVGRGVPRDPAAEARWYRQAAEAGYSLAQHELAVLYHLGEGVPADQTEAFAWFTVADAAGFDSRDALAVVRVALGAEHVAEAESRAAAYIAAYARR